MKKSLYLVSFLVLLIVVFWGGTRFNQRGASRGTAGTVERQVHHYVDPMNPAHTSQEPGIAPCGMPMEPVYADKDMPDGSGAAGSTLSASPGAVKINLQKQQIIGVQVDKVTRATETVTIRALGRVLPDENRVYPLIAATDGWMEEINGATTGSLVKANQLLAQIKVYNFNFFTWQQRYIAELGYIGGTHRTASPLLGPEQIRMLQQAGYTTGLPNPNNPKYARQTPTPSADTPQETADETSPVAEPLASADATLETPQSPNHTEELQPSPAPEHTPLDYPEHARMASPAMERPSLPPGEGHSEHMEATTKGNRKKLGTSREMNSFNPTQGRQELLNLGVEENQLQEYAKSKSYLTHVDLRSPVDGFVLSRKVSPLQRIDRGQECFRIADLGRVWVEADIFDIETKYIQPGTQARISMPKQNKHFTAAVSAIPPRFDAATRTFKVRLEMDNPENVLRPDMFVDVEFLIPQPESITVPSNAVIDSGTKKTVYVVMGEGIFEPRPVVTGWRSNDRVEIVEGLNPEETIVISGNFLIDSESRMNMAATKLMDDKAVKTLHAQGPLPSARPDPQTARPVMEQQSREATTLKDPVCGMPLDPDQATTAGLTTEVEGKTYYFCSQDCMKQFKQAPQRFLGETADKQQVQPESPVHSGHQHD